MTRSLRSLSTSWENAGLSRHEAPLLIRKCAAHDGRLFLDDATAGRCLAPPHLCLLARPRARGNHRLTTTTSTSRGAADRIGLIDHGKLLLEADKHELLRKFGLRTLRLTLSQRVDVLPASVGPAHLVDDGYAVEVTQPLGEDLGPVLAELLAAGLHVKDIETRAPPQESTSIWSTASRVALWPLPLLRKELAASCGSRGRRVGRAAFTRCLSSPFCPWPLAWRRPMPAARGYVDSPPGRSSGVVSNRPSTPARR